MCVCVRVLTFDKQLAVPLTPGWGIICRDKGNKTISPKINLFKNSFQQGISTPGIDRGLFSDTYITIKSIEDQEYKLIFKKNMGIQIIWLGLLITALSQIWKARYVFNKK